MSVRQFQFALAAAVGLGALVAPAHADPASKWRVEFNHKADNDGTLVLRISPEGGTPIDIETKIPAGTHENRAAGIARDSIKASLGKGYHVEVDDGEDVLIKRRGKTPKFEVTMVSSNITGLEIEIEKD